MKIYFLVNLFLVTSLFAFSKKPPSENGSSSSASSSVSSSSSSIAGATIQDIAANSACARVVWKDRGKAPAAYIKGLALTYARNLCDIDTPLVKRMTMPIGATSKDALELYHLSGESAKDRLIALYTLGVGLGMRESSGAYCTGRDGSASNVTASTAEAGLFQTSYNSVGADGELGKLFEKYQKGGQVCFLDVFKNGVSCKAHDAINYGSGNGLRFQEMAKSCPAFATQYAMLTLRVLRDHYGPILRREAEYKQECKALFTGIQSFIESHPAMCSAGLQ